MLFSILIPAYKKAFLDKCLNSCLAQTVDDYEIVIVDDASPEDLLSVIRNYEDRRIKYYRNEKNFGAVDVVDNWNRALEYSTGDYVMCIGDDDELKPDALELYSSMILKYPEVNVFHSRVTQIDKDSNPVFISETRKELESAVSFIRNRMDGAIQFIGDFCYKASWLKGTGGFIKLPLAWGSDDLTAFAAAKEAGVVHLPVSVFCYRISGLTISSRGHMEEKLQAINMQEKWLTDYLDSLTVGKEDTLEYQIVRSRLRKHINDQSGRAITARLRKNPFRAFGIFCKMKKYHVPFRVFMKSLAKSMAGE